MSASKKRSSSSLLLASSSSEVMMESSSSSSRRKKFQRDVTATELETLRAELDYERSQRALDAKRAQQVKQRLERQLQFALQEATEAKQLLQEVQDKSERHMQQLRDARSQALEELRECQQQMLLEEEERAEDAASNLNEKVVERLQAQVNDYRTENASLQELIRDLRQELDQQQQAAAEKSKETISSADEKDLSSGPAALFSEVTPSVLKELNRVRLELAEAQRKNRQLARSAEAFQKQANQVPQERQVAQEAKARAQDLEVQLQTLHRQQDTSIAEMKSWHEFGLGVARLVARESSLTISTTTTTDSSGSVAPELATVRRFVDELNQRANDALQGQERLERQLTASQDTVSRLERVTREYESKRNIWKEETANLQAKLDQLNKQVELQTAQEHIWKREVDSLRSMMKAFDELPLSPMKKKRKGTSGASSSTTIIDADGDTDASSAQATVQTLELAVETAHKELQVLKDANQVLTKDLKEVTASKDELQSKHTTVLEKFSKLREAVYAERAKAEQAEARAIQAEALAGKGSFDPEHTRVLHLKKNPLVDALRDEVSVLKRQVASLTASSNSSGSGDTGAGGSGSSSSKVGIDVDPNKLHQRLKQSFKEQIGRFREGVYLMTGYKIDMLPGSTGDRPMFRVRSLYAEREEDHLMFKWPDGDDVSSLDLLNTDMAKILTTTPSYEYMTKFHSLPAFLASVQLSLFEKQTVM